MASPGQKRPINMTLSRRLVRVMLPSALAVVLVGTQAAWAGQVSLHGSTTVMNTIIGPNKTEIERQSGQQLELVGNGSQRGIADLVAGRAQIAMISAPLAQEVRKVNEKTQGGIDVGHLKAHQIGKTTVAFAVHQSNAVRTLTNRQLADVFTGKVKNWKELGGADQEIIIVTAQPGDGLRAMVEANLLDGADLPTGARAMTNATQIAKVVSQLPGGIGIVAPTSLDGSVAELRGDDPIVQPLVLVTVGEETSEVRRVIEAAIIAGRSSHPHLSAVTEPGF